MSEEAQHVLGSTSPPPKTLKEKLKERRIAAGRARESDEEEPEGEPLEEGATILHKLWGRRVTLHPGNIARKSGRRIRLQEADALRVAERAGLPVPRVHSVETTPDGDHHISMDYIQGQVLKEAWPTYSADQKRSVIMQMRAILTAMRSVPPPDAYIGDCAGLEIHESRLYLPYTAPACRNEQEFNAYLIGGLVPQVPGPIRRALASRICRTGHRVVLTHCDLAPRNIIVRDGTVVGIIDWEEAGWYPEYWEYVKFFQRNDGTDGDWRDYGDEMFPQSYHDELVEYVALSRWQSP